ncbi:MAG: cytochrome c oxidase subunit II [Polyangiaceae bacterium]|nr:cytochrome c oxidase subunit II [Polyangiaceae bacterium]
MTFDPIELGSFWMPRQSSTIASEIDFAWYVVYWFDVLMFFGLMIPMFYFIRRFRRRTDNDKVSSVTHSTALEIGWTVIPSILVIALFFVGLRGYLMASVAPANAMEIRTTAEMYMWTFTYPNGTTSVNELVVPKDKPVKLIMSSKDVLHSFYVPEFRVKQDVVPGTYTTLWFEANAKRDTVLLCTEYCGVGHSDMMAKVHVMEQADYNNWLETGRKPGDPILAPDELGKKLFTSRSCNTCHSLDGTRVQGPSFKGLFGKTEKFADGSSAQVDENYIRESLLEPTKKVVEGYPAVMPTYKGLLKENEIDALIAYIKTVK